MVGLPRFTGNAACGCMETRIAEVAKGNLGSTDTFCADVSSGTFGPVPRHLCRRAMMVNSLTPHRIPEGVSLPACMKLQVLRAR